MTAVVSRERARTTGLTAAAGVLMKALAGQTSLPWPDEFPKKRPEGSASGVAEQ